MRWLALALALITSSPACSFTSSHKFPVAGPINPAWVAGLKEEFFAEDGCTVSGGGSCNNGATVAGWADQSGTANNIACATGPEYQTEQINGFPAITGNGSTQYCTRASTDDVGTLIIVGKYNLNYNGTPSTSAAFIGADSATASSVGSYGLQAWSNSWSWSINEGYYPATFYRLKSGEATFTPSVRAPMPPPIGAWAIYGGRLSASRIALENGVLPVASTSGGSYVAIRDPVMFADYSSNSITDYCGCSITAVLHYTPDVSDAQYASIALWLQGKYALQPQGGVMMAAHQNITQALYTLQGRDGVHWTYRPISYVVPGTNSIGNPREVRDPSFYVDQTGKLALVDGVYWLFHTDASFQGSSQPNDTFAVASCIGDPYESEAGPAICTFQQDVACVPPGSSSGLCWAPKPYMDDSGDMHVLLTINGSADCCGGAGMPYEIHPSGSPGGAWSGPSQVTGTSTPADTIDSRIIRDGSSTRYIFMGYDGGGNNGISILTSTADFTGYTVSSNNNCENGEYLEAPSALEIGSIWFLYADQGYGSNEVYCTGSSIASPSWSSAIGLSASLTPFRPVAPQIATLH